MWNLKHLIIRLFKDRTGATVVEYGLIATLIAAALIAGQSQLYGAINARLFGLASNITNGK